MLRLAPIITKALTHNDRVTTDNRTLLPLVVKPKPIMIEVFHIAEYQLHIQVISNC